MPHLRLEYSSNLPASFASRELFLALHRILAEHGVSIENCKSRPIVREEFVVGSGKDEIAFVHLDVRLLEGRSAETKSSLGREMLSRLKETYEPVTPEVQITVEIRDIERESYFKHPAGTI